MGRALRGGVSGPAGGAHRGGRAGADQRGAGLIELAHLQVVSAALFTIGIYGVLARRSAVLILMSIELMLNAVSINLVGFAAFVPCRCGRATGRSTRPRALYELPPEGSWGAGFRADS